MRWSDDAAHTTAAVAGCCTHKLLQTRARGGGEWVMAGRPGLGLSPPPKAWEGGLGDHDHDDDDDAQGLHEGKMCSR